MIQSQNQACISTVEYPRDLKFVDSVYLLHSTTEFKLTFQPCWIQSWNAGNMSTYSSNLFQRAKLCCKKLRFQIFKLSKHLTVEGLQGYIRQGINIFSLKTEIIVTYFATKIFIGDKIIYQRCWMLMIRFLCQQYLISKKLFKELFSNKASLRYRTISCFENDK